MLISRRWTVLVAALALLGAACGDDGGGGDTDEGASETTSTEAATTTTEAGPCAAESALTISNSDGLDGPLDVVTGFADVTLDSTADLVFADYEIEEDPQFGLSAPVGDPGAPDGGSIFQVTLTAGSAEILEPGDFPEQGPESALDSPGDITDPDADIPSVPPSIAFVSLYNGAERILPLGTHAVTLTEIDETQVCGTITGSEDASDLQADGFPIVTGDFVIDVV